MAKIPAGLHTAPVTECHAFRLVRQAAGTPRKNTWFVVLGALGGGCIITLSAGFAQTVAGAGGAAPVPSAASVAPAVLPSSGRGLNAADSALFDRLLSDAQYWLTQHQFDRVSDTVKRALNIAPQDPQALLLLGTAQQAQGDSAGAEKTLAQMEANGAPQEFRMALRRIIATKPVDRTQLAKARALAASGKMFQAAQAYKALFGNDPPPPDLALEYYGVLGSTILGYQEAVSRLKLWLQQKPTDLDAQLLYYQILTYRETSRAAGLERLKVLASADISPRIRRQAYAAWRQTLLWEAIRGSSVPMYYEWLAQHPNDAEIADRLAKARAEQSRIDADTARMDGYGYLHSGHVSEAEKGFRQALAYNAKDAAALGGMGLVAERQHDWRRAELNFKQAIAADPATAGQWQAALVGMRKSMAASNPLAMQIARAIAAHRDDDARRYIVQLANQPGQQAIALLFRAQLEMQEGHRAEAEEAYRGVLLRLPQNKAALSMLITMLLQDGRVDDAAEVIHQTGNVQTALAARVHSAQLVQQAEHATDEADRVSLLSEAVGITPNDPWLRLKLAQALVATHRPEQAQAVMDVMLDQRAPSQEALAAGVVFADGQNDFAASARLLKRMPSVAMTPDMRRLMGRAQAGMEVEAAESNTASPVAGLLALANRPDPTGQRAQLTADALLKHDEAQAAYTVLKKADMQVRAMPLSQRLNFAGLYLHILAMPGSTAFHRKVSQDITANLDAFDAQAQTTQPTEHEMEVRRRIEDGFTAIQADDLVRSGWPDDAQRLLSPYIDANPDAFESRLALARMYAAKDMPERALVEDLKVLHTAPDNQRVLAATVHDATMAGDADTADTMARRLQAVAPNAAETWGALAESAQSNNNTRMQLAAMEHVQAVECDNKESEACERHAVLEPDYRWPLIEASYRDLQGVMLPASYHYLPDDTTPEVNNRSIVYLHDSLSPQLDGNIYVRNRTGIDGLGQMTELALPLTATLPFQSWDHRLSFSLTPTFLFTGNPIANAESNHQFGQCATVGPDGRCGGPGHHYYVQGVGLSVNYVNRWFSADVGSTPLGFPIANVVGGVEFAPHLTRELVLRMSGGRRMVTNSELSYAGMKDPVSGREWGGVTREFGHAMLEWGLPTWNLYAGAGFAYLDGTHVVANTELDVQAGGNAQVWQDREKRMVVRTGLNFSYYSYRRNSYLFTWGQGGYFSPQTYYAIMVPLEWSGHRDMWTWLLRGEGGFQHYHSDATQYFPLDDGLQPTAIGQSTEGAQSASGAAGNVQGRIVYQVTPSLRLGAQASYSRAGSWSEISAILMAHYTIDSF